MESTELTYVVHEHPVGRGSATYIAQIDLAPFDFGGILEQVWLEEVRPSAYAMRCIPFRAYGLALGDEVRLDDAGSRVTSLSEPSGHRVLRALLMPSDAVGEFDDTRQDIIDAVERCDLLHEWSGDRHLAVDVPPGAEVGDLLETIGAVVDRGDAHWEWADAMPFRT